MGLFSRNSSSNGLDATTTRAPRWSAARGSHTARVNGQAVQHGLSRSAARRVASQAASTETSGKSWGLHW